MDGIGDKTADLFHGQAQLYRLMYLWMSSSCLKCATELEIPGIIHKHGKPISLSQLVSALKVPPSKATFVKELMRLLAHNGLFAIIKSNNNEEESEEVSYDLTSASKLLVSGTDHCLSPMVQLTINPTMINLYHHLGKWVRGKENTLRETSCGVGVYESLTQNPADLEAFQEAMASDSRFMKVALRDLESVFDGLSSIVDVGGGTGTTAKIICEAFPKLKCIVLDLPELAPSMDGIGGKTRELFHGQSQLLKYMYFWMSSVCLKCVIELEIPDIIHKHGKSIPFSQLVSALKVPPSKATFVKGLMRLLAHNGLFSIIRSNNNEEESEEVAYDLTSASQLLVSGTNHCLTSMVQWALRSARFEMYQHLGKWVRGKENTLRETAFGVGFYDFLNQNPADLAAFQEAMASDSEFMKVALPDLEPIFEGLSSIVDVGGGTGTTAKIICEAFPKLKCTVLDLPDIVAGLSELSSFSLAQF